MIPGRVFLTLPLLTSIDISEEARLDYEIDFTIVFTPMVNFDLSARSGIHQMCADS